MSIKPELGYHFLFKGKALLQLIGLASVEKWVALVLDIFDAKGLNPAKEFIVAPKDHPLFIKHWGRGVSFHEVHGILHNYVHALGDRDFHLKPAPFTIPTTLTIYVPERISSFSRKEDNALLYKIMITHKFLQTELGTYRLNLQKISPGKKDAFPVSGMGSPQESSPHCRISWPTSRIPCWPKTSLILWRASALKPGSRNTCRAFSGKWGGLKETWGRSGHPLGTFPKRALSWKAS